MANEDQSEHQPAIMAAYFSPRFLVISLGNPGAAYRDTFHNAGHIALNAIQPLLPDQPPFMNERIGKKACLNSINNPYHLAQSPTFMNTCGQWAAKSYKETLIDRGLTPAELGFVLVHDDLEQELGKVKILSWKKSPQGHNGVKSCHEFMQQSSFKGSEGRWHRIAVGIGRPQSRDAKTVADYVLSPMSRHQKGVFQEKAAPGVIAALKQLEMQWEKEFVDAQKPTGKL